jgi:PKD repeat protein
MGTTQNNSIIPQSPGSLSIRLTATNIDGSDDETKIDYITVILPAPVADFIADTTT